MVILRKSPFRLLVTLVLLLIVAVTLGGCSSTPTQTDELARFKSEYKKIEPDVSMLMDSFQPLMLRRDVVQLHQMELKAKALQDDWDKLQFRDNEIGKMQFEVSMALLKTSSGYGQGYIYAFRGDNNQEIEGNAIDTATEGFKHIASMYEKMGEVQTKLAK